MSRSKYINTFETTADYNNYIESALPKFPNVGYDKEADEVIIRRQSPNDYQIWGTTTATENFNIKLNEQAVEVTVDPQLGEFYLTSWTGTLTSLRIAFLNNTNITSIKKFAIDTSHVTDLYGAFSGVSLATKIDISSYDTKNVATMANMFYGCSSLTSIDLSNLNISSVTTFDFIFYNCSSLTTINLNNLDLSNVSINNMFSSNTPRHDIYINVEATLMKLTDNLNGGPLKINATIHYDNGSEVIDYKWQNNKWTPQS